MSHPLFRRKRKIIKPGYQLKVAFATAIFLFIYSLVLGFIIFYPLSQELYLASTMEDKLRISQSILSLHKRVWPAVFVVSALVYIHTILTSHRVAGPVYRLGKAVEKFLEGNFGERIRLRKSDQFKEIEEAANSLAEYLGKAKKRDGEFHADIRKRLSEIHSSLKAKGSEEDLSALLGLIKELDNLPDAFTEGTESTNRGF